MMLQIPEKKKEQKKIALVSMLCVDHYALKGAVDTHLPER